MKKTRIGIFGKTLFFTIILMLIVSSLIVSVFSAQFIRYFEETKHLERENKIANLIIDIQTVELSEAKIKLQEHANKYMDTTLFLLSEDKTKIAWKPSDVQMKMIKFPDDPAENTAWIFSKTQSEQKIKQEIILLKKIWAEPNQSSYDILTEYNMEHPEVGCFFISLKNNQLQYEFTDDNIWVEIDGYENPEPEENKMLEKNNQSLQKIKIADESYQLFIYQEPITYGYFSALSQILLMVFGLAIIPALAGAFIFAKWMTHPVKQLAKDTRKMINREDVILKKTSSDEIGDLTRDVHFLYEQLTTSMKDLEHEMHLVQQLEENQRSLFTAASHELKTPVAALSALLEGMFEEVGDYKNHPKYLKESLKITDSMKRLIAELLEVVHLDEQEDIIVIEEINLFDLFSEKQAVYTAIAESNDQELSIDIPDNFICIADKNRLSCAVDNIIMNALQNTKKYGKIKVWADNCSKTMNIWNEGAHIPEEYCNHLFDPFFRMDQVRSRKSGHSGLGLTITKRLLDSMNLSFALTNQEDGVLFQITFKTNE